MEIYCCCICLFFGKKNYCWNDLKIEYYFLNVRIVFVFFMGLLFLVYEVCNGIRFVWCIIWGSGIVVFSCMRISLGFICCLLRWLVVFCKFKKLYFFFWVVVVEVFCFCFGVVCGNWKVFKVLILVILVFLFVV